MLKHWITLTLRNALKYGLFTFINVLSLAIGFTCCLAILLYVQDELAYDTFHKNKSRIARITTTSTFNENENRYSRTPVPLAGHIKTTVRDAEKTGRMAAREATIFVHDKKMKSLEPGFFFTDPEALSIFSFSFLHGDPNTALNDIKSAVVTESIAKKYFGSSRESVGKVITVENQLELTITAVIEDWPATSHIRPDILVHFDNYLLLENENIREYLQHDWLYTSVFTYVLLREGALISSVSDDINKVRETYADERVRKNIHYSLQPLTDIHLRSNFSFDNSTGSMRSLYIFSFVGILILVIACFNFINLSIARSLRRNKEIGMKKVLGLDKKILIIQLLGESLVYVIVASWISVAFVYTLLPIVNTMTEKELSLFNLFSANTLMIITLVIVFTGLLAGGYPAFYIAGIDVYKALKGQALRPGKFQLRKILVVVQFLIAISLILFTFLVGRQLQFMSEKTLGFDKDHMLTIPLFSDNFNSILGTRINADYRKRMIAFEETVLQNSNIRAITCSSFLPGQGAISALIQTDSLTEQSNVFIPLVSVDYDFIETYQVKLLGGRNFGRQFGTDHLQAFIINEEAVKQLGFKDPEHAIGKHLAAVGKEGQVVGVISNYHTQGLQFALQPLVLEVAASKFSIFSVKINSTDTQGSIQLLKNEWDKFFPESIFEYSFLEDELTGNYQREQKLALIIRYASILAYIIAGLGLFGLAAYINEQRVKEVGIRKVLGATTRSIFVTLSSEFMKLIAIAFVIAIPLSLYLMNEWLSNFHYKTTISAGIFLLVMVITIAIVLIMISYQTIKISRTNPAEVLKME